MYNPYNPYAYLYPNQGMTQYAPNGMPTMFSNNAMQQPSQTQNRGPTVLYVPSAKDFNNVSVQPGQQALVIAQNDPFIAFKNADAMGMVQTTLCRLQEATAEEIDGPGSEYVTRAELQHVLANIVQPLQPKEENK